MRIMRIMRTMVGVGLVLMRTMVVSAGPAGPRASTSPYSCPGLLSTTGSSEAAVGLANYC